ESQWSDLLFAWRVAKFVKSNAIVFCRDGMTLGVGAGQMSRVDSSRLAAMKAQAAKLSLAGSVVASDAFFPFRDGFDVVAEAGAGCAFGSAVFRIFGPRRGAAQVETSKDFAKSFMLRHGIPTARHASFERAADARAYIVEHRPPIVIKADGLAGGKGVVVAQ